MTPRSGQGDRRCQQRLKPGNTGRRCAHIATKDGYCDQHQLAPVIQLVQRVYRSDKGRRIG